MYTKSIALFVAIYGRSVLAALDDSCFAGETTCVSCTPQNTEYEPAGTGQVWYSSCCTASETDNADPPVTTTKKYCWNWTLKDHPSNQFHGQKPTCGEKASGNIGWDVETQCTTTAAATGDAYVLLTPDTDGCPGPYDSSKEYEIGDTVEDNGTIYTCKGSAAFCSLYGPNLRGTGLLYWRPTASCAGTTEPTEAPTFGTTQEGCPAEFDSSTEYSAGDSISVTLKDGRSVWYTCKNFPASEFCNVDVYSPLSTQLQCNGELCWPDAWIYQGGCTGTYTPTQAPTFDPADLEGCPEEYDSGTAYKSGDEVSVLEDGETAGKIYRCKDWPEGGNCVKEAYRPGGKALDSDNSTPLWKSAWTYQGGCSGTIAPTQAPTFDPADLEGCPEEYDSGTAYGEGDEVSVLEDGLVYGKIYECKAWPEGGNCVKEAYRPGGDALDSDGSTPLWKSAWTYQGGCSGTIAPTQAPTFDPADLEGCPEEYDSGTTYAAEDEVSVLFDGETDGKRYKCKPWPDTGYCNLEAYKPGGDALEPDGSKPLWKRGWTYEGGCSGTISPTQAPVFVKLAEWDLGGCPPEYVPGYPYDPLDYVSISKNDDNTYGVVWQCKDGESSPWCQNEGFAPGNQYAEQAWEKVGHCSGTIAPTVAPSAVEDHPTDTKDECHFKKKLSTSEDGEYVILPVLSWDSGGYTEATVSGGVPLKMYETGDLVRSGRDTYKCNGYPYHEWCSQHSPFVKDSSYNYFHSPKAWSKAECEELIGDPDAVFGVTTSSGAVFASNGNLLVDKDGVCQTGEDTPAVSGAINPEDYFKTQPTAAKPCQKCDTDEGLGAPVDSSGTLAWDPKICEACLDGTTGKLVDRVSRCVCDNGATDPWDVTDSDAQCTKCPGKKFLGYNFGQGQGKCVDACPSSHPYYYTKTSSTDKYYVCCKEPGCANVVNTDRSGCHDGGALDAIGGDPVCEAAYP